MSQEWTSNAYPDAPEYLAIKQYAHKILLAGRKESLYLEDWLSRKVVESFLVTDIYLEKLTSLYLD